MNLPDLTQKITVTVNGHDFVLWQISALAWVTHVITEDDVADDEAAEKSLKETMIDNREYHASVVACSLLGADVDAAKFEEVKQWALKQPASALNKLFEEAAKLNDLVQQLPKATPAEPSPESSAES